MKEKMETSLKNVEEEKEAWKKKAEEAETSLQTSAMGVAEERERLQTRIEELEQKMNEKSENETEIASLQDQIASLQQENNSLHDQNDELIKESNSLHTQNDALTQQCNALQSSLTALQQKNEELTANSLQSIHQGTAILRQENEDLHNRVLELITGRENALKSVYSLESQLSFHKNELSSYEKQVATLTTSLNEKNREIGRLKGQLCASNSWRVSSTNRASDC